MSPRCFIALDIDTCVRRACETAQERLARLDDRLRDEKWVAPRNLHVTLAFIGDTDADATEDLIRGLDPVVNEAGPIILSKPRVCARPAASRASMIWAALDDPTGRFAAAAIALDQVGQTYRTAASGPQRTQQKHPKPVPHLTLCRLRRARRLDPMALADSQQAFQGLEDPMSYPRVTLYSSRLAPQGPTYSELFVWHMRGE